MDRRYALVAALAALAASYVFSHPVGAQSSSPLTVQPQTGRVGIGTTAPGYTLDVIGTINASAFRGDASQLTNLPASTQWTTVAGPGISYSGKVGVGTTTPVRMLDLKDVEQAVMRVQTTGPGGRVYEFGVGSAASGTIDRFGISDVTAGGWGRLVIEPNGNVGIGTGDPDHRLEVNGSFAAASKSFKIPHPTDATRHLLHGAVEGPEFAVFYRGEGRLERGEAIVVLPSYFEALTRREGRTVQLTARGSWSPLYVDGGVEHGQFIVRAGPGAARDGEFYWEVKAVRADVAPLETETLVRARRMPGRDSR